MLDTNTNTSDTKVVVETNGIEKSKLKVQGRVLFVLSGSSAIVCGPSSQISHTLYTPPIYIQSLSFLCN